jgi:WASH complex subunit CCDC53
MQAPIDYNTVEPIPYNKTVSIVNHFVINTTQFLNKFSYLCETKLATVARNLERLETTMSILEAKLASIPGLEGITAAQTPLQSIPQNEAVANGAPQPSPSPSTLGSVPPPSAPPPASGAAPSSAPPPVVMTKLKDHPEYATYFKMLRLGIPPPQIKMKMEASGHNPAILDMDPEGPAPASLSKDEESESESEDEKAAPVTSPPPPGPPPGSANPTNNAQSESESSEED